MKDQLLKYEFPNIENMEVFDKLATDEPDFLTKKVNDDYGYALYSYNILGKDGFFKDELFPYRLETRGIVFDTNTGRIIRRPFQKFFNLGEMEGIQLDDLTGIVDSVYDIRIEEKVDGSMVSPIYTNAVDKGYILSTKRDSDEFRRERLHNFVKSKGKDYESQLDNFIERCRKEFLTPIFEYVSPDNRIVVEYNEPALYFLSARDLITGEYVEITPPEIFMKPRLYGKQVFDFNDLVNDVRGLNTMEGVVFVLGNGHRLKVKSEWYTQLHYLLSETYINEKFLIDAILNDRIDDIKALSRDDVREAIERFERNFEYGIEMKAHEMAMLIEDLLSPLLQNNQENCRKEFALKMKDNKDGFMKAFGFFFLNGDFHQKYIYFRNMKFNGSRMYLIDFIKDRLHLRNTKFEESVLKQVFDNNLAYNGPKTQMFVPEEDNNKEVVNG